MTSVLRTYYTWKLVTQPDISYNVIIMGLWTLAELATGVIVCCAPVLPRFFRHTGPKIYHAFSTTFRTGSLSGSAGLTREKSENESVGRKVQGKNTYIELEEGRISPSEDEGRRSGTLISGSKVDT